MKNKDLKLITKNNISYYIRAITKDTHDIIKKSIKDWRIATNSDIFLGLDSKNIVAFGLSSDVDEEFVKEYIEYRSIPILDSNDFKTSAKCYAIEKHDCSNNILHNTCLDSWKCIMNLLNKPKYVLIHKEHAI